MELGVYWLPPGVLRQGTREMPINRLLDSSKLTPEEIERLNHAFTFALRSLSLVDRNDPLTELVARNIIEVGTGILDPAEIAKAAIKRLGIQ
jgi:hypothetical protein